ncbi:MAG: cellobiose phosphorylase [Candidatus Omnitrophica bacterium]|nr:cellobiose phosphorylase [Candidatus Omnitrophota bacterium]
MRQNSRDKEVRYKLTETGKFIIENYNSAKPLANFFPGIAGKYGIPMWVFYVNRGQGIACFGIDGKDHAILEFQPANKAWQQTSILGFRTFIKCHSNRRCFYYEPFHNGLSNLEYKIFNYICMSSYDLQLEEINYTIGLKTSVKYFTIPNDIFAALVRVVTIENISDKPIELEIIDGLPRIVPYGIANLFLKKLSRTIEAWMHVENLTRSIPFYKIDVDPIDRPYVLKIKGGNFYMAFKECNSNFQIIKPIVDPDIIFGLINDFSIPRLFLSSENFIYPKQQQIQCKTPCGFLHTNFKLDIKNKQTYFSVIGHCKDLDELNKKVTKKILTVGYLNEKEKENEQIIKELQNEIKTNSSSWAFDYYCQQTYLDNLLRGGTPVTFSLAQNKAVFYLYSRKHGDLERDYNKFQIQPTYFSQGNGNYRDINQNRRVDVWFHPEIKDFNIIVFLNLIQLDGFNPLVVKGASFTVDDWQNLQLSLNKVMKEEDCKRVLSFLEKPFTPGSLVMFVKEMQIKIKLTYDELIALVIGYCHQNFEAEHGEGFWIDHWHYNLDLLENYFNLYPEELRNLVFDKKVFTFYDNWHVVAPRSKKYVLYEGKLRQLNSVVIDEEKKKLIISRKSFVHCVHSEFGLGSVYYTTLINKLFCILVNKLASFDPFGVGIEMEADKPNWFDALNGLPALFGSSSCETFELKRLCLFLKKLILQAKVEKFYLCSEIYEFLMAVSECINEYFSTGDVTRDMDYWDKTYCLKESFREKIKLGVSGNENEFTAKDALAILESAIKKIDVALAASRYPNKPLYCGYFINEPLEYQSEKGVIKPKRFKQYRLANFLEAQVHALRVIDNQKDAKIIYQATRNSSLYDKKLKMYRVTGSLKKMPLEIGRCTAFTAGWLENQSVWLHMEYKYLLEVLKKGLYKEFYQDLRNCLVCFQEPEVYGRSILENSSFIVSSAFPYPKLHGNGFVARLSGSTAEFLEMWLRMNVGNQPFFLDEKEQLSFRLAPILAGWLFSKDKKYSFKFLGTITITYYNSSRKDTFGGKAVKPVKVILKNQQTTVAEFNSNIVPAPYAEQIRNRQITDIDVILA